MTQIWDWYYAARSSVGLQCKVVYNADSVDHRCNQYEYTGQSTFPKLCYVSHRYMLVHQGRIVELV